MKHIRTTTRRRYGMSIPRTVTDSDGRTFVVPQGGDEDDTRLDELVSRLPGEDGEVQGEPLTDEELAEAERLAVEAFDDADGDDPDVEAMEVIRDAIVSIRSEAASRDEAREQERQRAAEIRGEIHPAEENSDGENEGGEGENEDGENEEPSASDETGEGGENEGGEGEGESAEATAEERVPVAASGARRPSLGEAARRVHRSSAPRQRDDQQDGAVIVAAGDVPGVSAGARIESLSRLGRAFQDKARAVARAGARGGRFEVATIQAAYPEERQLVSNAATSQERIDAVVAAANGTPMETLLAAGGLCAPIQVDYSVETYSSTARPIRDALLRFGADRGGVRFFEPVTIAQVEGAVAIWTEENDRQILDDEFDPEEPGDFLVSKPCVRIDCGDEITELVDAFTRCLLAGNFTRRTFPEQFAAWWAAAEAAHARMAEGELFSRMAAASTAVTAAAELGAARDLLTTVDVAIAGHRSRHRLADNVRIRVIMPEWARELMRADLAKQMPGENTLGVTNEQIAGYFAVRNVAITWTPDHQVIGAQGAGVLVGLPATVEFLLFPEGSWMHVDGGELNFGVEIRDSALNAVNDSQAFTETFENVAFRGLESLHVTQTTAAYGATSGTVDLTA